MKIPKYWAKSVQSVTSPQGRAFFLSCWQWSDTSQAQAREQAQARVGEVARKVLANQQLDRYSYGERPLREEITQVVHNRANQEIAVVTRNAYGALVLNTARAMFIDIDFTDEKAGPTLAARLQQMVTGSAASQEERQYRSIVAWHGQHPELSLRVYRTFAGLRCLITNQVFEPGQAEAVAILHALGSDPLYVRLCQAQACFRARLTPKPWRCGIAPPPSRYPWEDFAAETHYRRWERQYGQAIAPYTACRLVKQLGDDQIHPEVEPALNLHDQLACSEHRLKLA